jgi:quercetin dioxygenase-like cupin family protein
MRRIDFHGVPWLEPAEGVRCQTVLSNGHQFRIVEFAVGISESNWCGNSHLGYVLAGRMEVEFRDAVQVFSVGDALTISAGDMHRARVVDGPVRLFLIEETQ